MKRTGIRCCGAMVWAVVMFVACGFAQARGIVEISFGNPIIVSQSPPGQIASGPWLFPTIEQLPDGRLHAMYILDLDSHASHGLPLGHAVSSDNGNSWTVLPVDDNEFLITSNGEIFNTGLEVSTLNGDRLRAIKRPNKYFFELLAMTPPIDMDSVPILPNPPGAPSSIRYYDASDIDHRVLTFDFARKPAGSAPQDPWIMEANTVEIPGRLRASTVGPKGRWLSLPSFANAHWKLAPDGSIIASKTYRRRENGDPIGDVQMYDSILFMRSTDYGKTWKWHSEIVLSPIPGYSWLKGYSEAHFNFMPDGSLVALVRTTVSGINSPLHIFFFDDITKQWSAPQEFDSFGVWPQFLTLNNGVTLSSYGRPGLFVRGTTDPSGKIWEDPVKVLNHEQTCGYSGMVPMSDNTALLIYTDWTIFNGITVMVRTVTVHVSIEAVIAVDMITGNPPLTVNFDGKGSAGIIVSYEWEFGDGTPGAVGPQASHAYTATGTYTATLTVTDKSGAQATASQDIYVGVTPPNAAANWKLDDGNGTTALDSSNGHHGTLKGSPSWTTGYKGGALSFDGVNDYVQVPDDPGLDFGTGDFSVGFWLNVANSLQPNTEYGVVNKNSDFQKSAGWGVEIASSTMDTYLIESYITNQAVWGDTNAVSPNRLDVNTWHYVVSVRKGITLTLYIDGVGTQGTKAASPWNVDNNQPIIFGHHSWGPSMPGILDDIKIWDRALSAPEVSALYNGRPSPDIKANGSDGPLVISKGESLEVTVSAKYNGDDADLWVSVDSSMIGRYWYVEERSKWIQSVTPVLGYAGPLLTLPSHQILNVPASGFPAGDYTFTFSVDSMDAAFDGTYQDTVLVTITP